MSDEHQIQQLLEELMDTRCSPEEVCKVHPELMKEVRRRWNRIKSLDHQLEAIFPTSNPTSIRGSRATYQVSDKLPVIEGYEVESILGRGGMGVVYQARQLKLNRIIAIKMLLAGAYASA
ncbi:MAG: hypothetical protein QM703_22560 [Gemmatales bacterium]